MPFAHKCFLEVGQSWVDGWYVVVKDTLFSYFFLFVAVDLDVLSLTLALANDQYFGYLNQSGEAFTRTTHPPTHSLYAKKKQSPSGNVL